MRAAAETAFPRSEKMIGRGCPHMREGVKNGSSRLPGLLRPAEGTRERSAVAAARGSTAADTHARHHHLLALAGTPVDLGASMELQILAEADAHRIETLGIAADRDRLVGQARI